MKRNAVLVRAGRRSRHGAWLHGAEPNFDLIVLNYEELDAVLTAQAARAVHIPGSKVAGYSIFFRENPEFFRNYDRVALLDDDLDCSAADINAAFSTGAAQNLQLWQPSLTSDSYFTYAVLQKNELFSLRYVNFIEMMCPFFTSSMLRSALPLFDLGYETGIDRIWCRLSAAPEKAYAVLDSVSFRHTRAVGVNSAAQGFAGGQSSYQDVLEEMERLSGKKYAGTVAYAGIRRDGARVENRKLMAVLSLYPMKDFLKNPTRRYFKRFLIAFRHNMTRDVDTQQIDLTTVVARLRRTTAAASS